MSPRADVLRFFHPVLPARALRAKPVRVTVDGRRFALWRDRAGTPAAVADACPHRQAPLSMGRVTADGRLSCPYHGWRFDREGRGCAPAQPALRCATAAYQVVEHHGYLWLGAREADPDSIPAFSWDGFELAGAFPMLFPAPLRIVMDNFTEDEHFSSVHLLLGWKEGDWPQVHFEAAVLPDRTTASYVGPQRAFPLLPLIGVRGGDLFHNHFESRFDPVATVYSSHWSDPHAGRRRPIEARTCTYMVPETEGTTRVHSFVFVRVQRGTVFRLIRPLLRLIGRTLVRLEWRQDARFVRHMANTAPTLAGLRLGRYDKTVIANRRLLDSHYYGRPVAGRA